MAIFGNLAEFPPHEVLSLVGARRGILAIRQPGRTIDLHLAEKSLHHFYENGLRVTDVLTLTDRFGRLLQSRAGEFWFMAGQGEAAGPLRLPVAQLIASTLRSLDERSAVLAELPSPHTIMVANGQTDLHFSEELQLYWERAQPHLRLGASALQLAGCTGITTDQSRWLLHRLRLAGAVRLRRAGEKTQFGISPSEADRRAPVGVSATAPDSGDLRGVSLGAPARGLLQRLITGFNGLFR